MAYLGKHFKINLNEVKSNDSVIFKGKTYRISVLSERLVRFEYNKNGIFLDAPTNFAINRNFKTPMFKFEDTGAKLIINTKYFSLTYIKERPFKGPIFAPDVNLRVKLLNTDKLWYPNHPEARNYKGSSFSLDDTKLEKGLYSTDGFVTIDDSKALIIEENGSLREADKDHTDFYLFMYRRDFGFCLSDYYTLTGYPALLPKYALGIWWNRDLIYNEDNLVKIVNLFNKYEIPISSILLSEYWHLEDFSKYEKTGYSFSKKLFPNLKDTIDFLHKRGIYLGLNLDPTNGIRNTDEAYQTFKKELNLKTDDVIAFNILNKTFSMTFVSAILDKLLEKNIDYFWIDYDADIKNLEALKYYTFNNFKRLEEKRGLILAKNSLVATHRYPVIYTGKTTVGWDTLKRLPFYNLTGSNIGLSWFSHDAGGFRDGIEDSELYLRYIQFSVFNPIFRFSAKRGAYYKREPWHWDIKTYSIAKTYTQLRYRLIPYLYSENYDYHSSGLPIFRPLYYDNPEIYDEPIYKNEYYFGSEFLIAPITKAKDVTMDRSIERVFLPKGIWYDFKSGKKFSGGRRYVLFYKEDEYPVFVKEGGIIPLASYEKNNFDINKIDALEINVFPGKNNVYKLYEDDGISNLYKDGYFIKTLIDYNYMKNNYTLIIRAVEGKTGIIPDERNYVIKFRNIKKADEVKVHIDGSEITRFKTYEIDLDFVVEVTDVPTTKQLTINCKGNNIEIDSTRIFNDDINSILDDLKIKTNLKEELASILFSDKDIKRKRVLVRKLKKKGLHKKFVSMFLKLLEYGREI